LTAQISDSILFEGETYALHSVPLADYFSLSGARFDLQPIGTCCWRGHVARWAIVDDRLYLTGLTGRLPIGTLTMAHVFPGFRDRVFAHWYSGELRLPHGPMIESFHAGFGGVFAQEWILALESGVVLSRSLHSNVPPQHDRQQRRTRWRRCLDWWRRA
jgi:hypothetical protein